VAVTLIIEQQAMPLDADEPMLSERMGRLAGQLERGEYITNEDMKQRVQQWLAK